MLPTATFACERLTDRKCLAHKADRSRRSCSGRAAAFGTCPYREHALVRQQEHEAWDVLLACQGQLRLAPSGHVIGVDMRAALELAAARGYELDLISELLPAAEAGFIVALFVNHELPA